MLAAFALQPSAFMAPSAPRTNLQRSKVMMNDPLATRDAAPSIIDFSPPVEPIFKSESFSEYMARRNADAAPAAAAPASMSDMRLGSSTSKSPSKPDSYDPWKDDDLTLVQLTVKGVTKTYRIKN